MSFFKIFSAEADGRQQNAVLLLDEPGVSLHWFEQREFRPTDLKAAGQLESGMYEVEIIPLGQTNLKPVNLGGISRPMSSSNNWLGPEIDGGHFPGRDYLEDILHGRSDELAVAVKGTLRFIRQAFYSLGDESRFLILVFALDGLAHPDKAWKGLKHHAYIAALTSGGNIGAFKADLGAAIGHDAGDRVCSFCKNVRAVADLSAVVKLTDKALSRTVHRVARPPGERRDARFSSFNTAHPFAELIKVNLRKAAPGVARGISDRLVEIGKARRAKGAAHAWSGRHRYAVNTLALPLKTVEKQWQRYRSAVERGGRFFNQDAKSFLDDLFAPLDRRDVNPSVLQPALVMGEIYRARLANTPPEVDVIRKKPAQQLGPPPPALAKTGRMNAERISFEREVGVRLSPDIRRATDRSRPRFTPRFTPGGGNAA